MKKLIKNIIYYFLRQLPMSGVVVLMYHSIGDNRESFTVSPIEFERQMKYLREDGFTIVSLGELLHLLKENLPFPPRSVVVTFDDGYDDNYFNAFPILKKYTIPATIFISSALIGEKIFARAGSPLFVLNNEQIRELLESGLITIGSHSHYHKKFTHLSEQEINDELSASKKILEALTGRKIFAMAYPSGRVNETVEHATQVYFDIACGVKSGKVNHSENLMNIKRNSIDAQVTFEQFKGIAKFGRI